MHRHQTGRGDHPGDAGAGGAGPRRAVRGVGGGGVVVAEARPAAGELRPQVGQVAWAPGPAGPAERWRRCRALPPHRPASIPCIAQLTTDCVPAGSCTEQATNKCYANGVKVGMVFVLVPPTATVTVKKPAGDLCYTVEGAA